MTLDVSFLCVFVVFNFKNPHIQASVLVCFPSAMNSTCVDLNVVAHKDSTVRTDATIPKRLET